MTVLFFCVCSLYGYYVVFMLFFFSSRRRHTSCALVTGVQTCALPIYQFGALLPMLVVGRGPDVQPRRVARIGRIDVIAPVRGFDVGIGAVEREWGRCFRHRRRRAG